MVSAARRHFRWTVALLFALSPIAVPAASRETVAFDLWPLIESTAQYPTRFAVEIARAASLQTAVSTSTCNKAQHI